MSREDETSVTANGLKIIATSNVVFARDSDGISTIIPRSKLGRMANTTRIEG